MVATQFIRPFFSPLSGRSKPASCFRLLAAGYFRTEKVELPIPASTANGLRRMDPEKLRAIAQGISQIGKDFVVATIIVFGGATVTFAFATSKLDLQSNDDIKAKVKSLLQPNLKVENVSKQETFQGPHGANEKPLIKELSKRFGRGASE